MKDSCSNNEVTASLVANVTEREGLGSFPGLGSVISFCNQNFFSCSHRAWTCEAVYYMELDHSWRNVDELLGTSLPNSSGIVLQVIF